MGGFPISQFFRLSDDGVRCDANGLFVGGMPMLTRTTGSEGPGNWEAHPLDDQNSDVSFRYGLPIDLTVKQDRLASVARALQRGDLARAQMSALLLRLPEPLSLAKGAPATDLINLAGALSESGVLKADWDAEKHPRTGEAPNPGWFAPKDEVVASNTEPKPTMTAAPPTSDGFAPISEDKPLVPKDTVDEPPPNDEPAAAEPSPRDAQGSKPQKPKSSPRGLLKTLRGLLKLETYPIVQVGSVVDWATDKLSGAIGDATARLQFLMDASPAAVDLVAVRSLHEALAAQDPPKTLKELQTLPAQNSDGYDDHHLVQQNDINVAKSLFEISIEKFGWNVINAPSNRVWIPRVKHRIITDYYGMIDLNDTLKRRRRVVIRDLDYDAQYADALRTLRLFGVLQ